MKTLRFFLYVSLILTACSIAPTTDNENFLVLTKSAYEVSNKYAVSKEQALSFIDTSGFSKCNILISKDVVAPNTETISVTDSYSPNFSSWLIFVDLHPYAFWAHDCISYYVNVSTGEVVSSNNRFPPSIPMDTLQCINPISSSYQLNVSSNRRDESQARTSVPKDYTKWAVIMGGGFSGHISANNPSIWTECSEIYRMLCDKYSYPQSQVKILFTNNNLGTDFNLNGLPDDGVIDFTKSKVSSVFDTLCTQMALGDTLSVFVMTHGETVGNDESVIVLWDGTYYYDYEFATQINRIPVGIPINVIMGQCYSGGFIGNLNQRCSYIATACAGNEVSWEATNIGRSEFYRHWLTAMNWFNAKTTNQSIDADNNKIITFSEAFIYADSEDVKDNDTPLEIETRMEASNPLYYAETVGLSTDLSYGSDTPVVLSPILIGPQNLRVGNRVTYRLANIPNNSTVLWNWPSQFILVDTLTVSDYSTATFDTNNSSNTIANLSIGANISNSSGIVTKWLSNINIWKPGINISNDLIVGNLTSSGGIVQVCHNFDGVNNYNWYSDNGWNVISQGSHIAEFTNQYRDDNQYVTVSVDFTNPLGDQTTFVRTFSLNN